MSKKQIWSPKYYPGAIFPTVVAEGLCVKLGTNENEFVIVSAVSDAVYGVVQLAADKANGDGTLFTDGGEAYGLAGGAIAKGDEISVNASGEFITPTAAGTYRILGIAKEAAADAAFVRFLFTRYTKTIA